MNCVVICNKCHTAITNETLGTINTDESNKYCVKHRVHTLGFIPWLRSSRTGKIKLCSRNQNKSCEGWKPFLGYRTFYSLIVCGGGLLHNIYGTVRLRFVYIIEVNLVPILKRKKECKETDKDNNGF